jgi:type IV pilus assembly protein PilN
MARINLLPWREELRRQRLRQFVSVAIGSVILAFLVVVLVHMNIAGAINAQDSRNDFLKRKITEVEEQIKEINELEAEKQRLLSRMEIIQQLQRNRPEIVHLFDEIVRRVPDGISLSSIKQSGNSVVITGRAQSNARVSALMRNLNDSDWFAQPRLDVIQSKGKGDSSDRASDFTLRVQQVRPQPQQDSNQGEKKS